LEKIWGTVILYIYLPAANILEKNFSRVRWIILMGPFGLPDKLSNPGTMKYAISITSQKVIAVFAQFLIALGKFHICVQPFLIHLNY